MRHIIQSAEPAGRTAPSRAPDGKVSRGCVPFRAGRFVNPVRLSTGGPGSAKPRGMNRTFCLMLAAACLLVALAPLPA
jgi:hypothetical protein